MSQELGTEAVLIGYLMEVGWELFVTDDPNQPPKLVKCVTTGNTTEVRTCDVSTDTVIELQTAKRLKKRKQFTSSRVRTFVYVLREIPK